MFKILGMLVGSGIVLFFVLAGVNPPQAKKTADKLTSEVHAAIDTVQHTINDAKPSGKPIEAIDNNVQSTIPVEPKPKTEPLAQDTSAAEKPTTSLESVVSEQLQDIFRQPQWYVFWEPFNSKGSATGFITRLNRQTQHEFMVMADAGGGYRVALAYTDEANKRQSIADIEAITGLNISGTGHE